MVGFDARMTPHSVGGRTSQRQDVETREHNCLGSEIETGNAHGGEE